MSRLEIGDWFLIAIACLQFCAVLGFLYKRRWNEAIVYVCYMTAQISLLLMSMKGR